MANTLYDRTIAFAGLCQAAALVQQVARNGQCDKDAFETSLQAIICMDPKDTVSVFGHERNLKLGLETMVNGIDGSTNGSELTRYIISLLALQKKLSGRNDAMSQLGDRLDMLSRQTEHFDLLEDQMLSNLASVYLDVISPIGPRIQITGTPAVLQQTTSQNKVRALLLGGIRCAVLWNQVGGKRRHLIFGRKKMVEQAKQILQHI